MAIEHNFPEKKMMEELEQLIRGIAENVENTIGEEAAKAILKQPSGNAGDPFGSEVDLGRKLDMDQYPITCTFRLAYDYVINARWPGSPKYQYFCKDISEPLEDLSMFMDLWGHLTPETSLCRYICDAAFARWYVDVPEEANDLDFKGLALLAKVDERTVRNATNEKAQNPLRTIRRGGRTFVTPEDALAWLKTRPGFKETVFYEDPPPDCKDQISNPSDLGRLIAQARDSLALNRGQLLERLGWGAERLAYLADIEEGKRICQFEDALPLANALNQDADWFLLNVMNIGYQKELNILQKTVKPTPGCV